MGEGAAEDLVHLTQMKTELAEDLASRKLLAAAGEWARMSPEVARLYRITMANVAAGDSSVAPVTDHVSCDVAAIYFANRKVTRERTAVPVDGFAWARLGVPFPAPAAIAALSVRKLLELRVKLAKQRHAFRQKVQARASVIATLPSQEAIQSRLRALGDEIEDDVHVQRDALRAARVHEAWTVLEMSAPVSIGAGLTVLGAPPMIAGVGGVGSVGFALTNWYVQHQIEQGGQGHYLLSLESKVDKLDVSRACNEMDRLVHGAGAR